MSEAAAAGKKGRGAGRPGSGPRKGKGETGMPAPAHPLADPEGGRLVRQASELTVGDLVRNRARMHPERVALEDERRRLTFGELDDRVNRLAHVLAGLGVERGDRVALLSENRVEYLEVVLAGAKLGAIVCCLNWRLAPAELEHCVRLVTPKLAIVSERHRPFLGTIDHGLEIVLTLGEELETRIGGARADEPGVPVHPEDGLLIIYTSGTTGLPKGALISHRAEIARMAVNVMDSGLGEGDTFVAWPPMFHMASTEQGLHALGMGGKVLSVDGFDVDRIVQAVREEPIWWLCLMPGMVDRMIDALKVGNVEPRGVKLAGAMADLVPRHQIAEVTSLLRAPYMNTFGATETGIPPASRGRIPPGVVPESLAKTVSSLCQIRLVDEEDRDVPDGTPGELAIRGPTVFSGYWNAPEVNRRDFRGGWFHMGDCFIRHPDGRLDFVDRVKYLIKSGGENIYPAEIERVLLAEPRVDDAVVVRAPDPRWGEVPVAFVARNDPSLTREALDALCLEGLARYKRPRACHFVPFEALPRSTTGKIQRHEVERWIEGGPEQVRIPLVGGEPGDAGSGSTGT